MKQTAEKKVQTYESKVVNATVTVIGEPNIDAWARKVRQVYGDLEAGRYSDKLKEEAV